MLSTLKQTGKNIGREINRAWEGLSEGWRELLSRSSDALTQFKRHPAEETGMSLDSFPRWGLLAGELEETSDEVVLPGMDKGDCQICIEGNVLYISGEKRFTRDASDSTYHVMERAYGAFQRTFPLPRHVKPEQAEASFRNGVLTVRLPKLGRDERRSIQIS